IEYSNIEKFKNICGVWVMYNENDRLLEVAQTSNIFGELAYDLSWIMKKYPKEVDRTKRYAARRLLDFNKKFDVLRCDKNRTTAKYRNIAEESERIFVYVVLEEEAVSDDRFEREKIELKIAIDNQAAYWNAYGKQRKMAKAYYASVNTNR
ncbi:MAG: hypothetical protein K2J67_00620, partial [Lachnospiraceae bacterium]|nr:hypothetical protein [Lachnospiraceae bacterium]